jgi:hypothetical protein
VEDFPQSKQELEMQFDHPQAKQLTISKTQKGNVTTTRESRKRSREDMFLHVEHGLEAVLYILITALGMCQQLHEDV